ncbi:MAG: type II toxin-antitoxin system HicA family toxin [Candidatus Scalindua sp.]
MCYKRLKIIKALNEYGFEFLREGRNHTIFANDDIKIPIGRHKEISPGTARKIAKEIHVPWVEFVSKIS